MELKKEEIRTYRQLYQAGRKLLEEGEDAALDARLLLEEVCGTDLQTLLVFPERPVTEEEISAYEALLERRRRHEPTAMILGKTEFMGLPFIVTKDVLIPEQDTEVLVEQALSFIKSSQCQAPLKNDKPLKILDLCTGSGCILLSFLHHFGYAAEGVGCDLSERALSVAKKNEGKLRAAGLLSGEQKVEWKAGDLFAPLEDERFDMILSNPPYIPTKVIGTLPEEVRLGEPFMALDGGEDGLSFYRRIAGGIRFHLKPNGIIILETGYDQGESVPRIFRDAGYEDIRVVKDYGGNDRVVIIRTGNNGYV